MPVQTPPTAAKKTFRELSEAEIEAAVQEGDIDLLLGQLRPHLIRMGVERLQVILPAAFEAAMHHRSLSLLSEWVCRTIVANDLTYLLRAKISCDTLMRDSDIRRRPHEDYHPVAKAAVERLQRCEDRMVDLLERVARITRLFAQAENHVTKAKQDEVPVLNIADMFAEAKADFEREQSAATAS